MNNSYLQHSTAANSQVINHLNTMTDEQIIRECTPFLYSAIRKLERMCNCKIDRYYRDDLINEGWLKIFELRSGYDPSRNSKFLTYVYKPAFYAILEAFKREIEHGQVFVYDEELTEHYDIAEDPYERQSLREECDDRLSVIDPTDAWIVKEVFGLNDGFEHSNESAAFTLGISAERIRQRLGRAMKQLKMAA